jgi:hypothetical protein
MQLTGSFRKAARFSNDGKRPQVVQFHTAREAYTRMVSARRPSLCSIAG